MFGDMVKLLKNKFSVSKKSDCDAVDYADYTPSALACTFGDDLAFKVGASAAEKCNEKGNNILFVPDINIKRSLLDGRGFEKLSEDPLLSGRMGAAFIDGAHSAGGEVSVKNYALRNQETGNMTVNVEVDERALRDIYLAPFEYVFKNSSPDAVTLSNHSVRGEAVSENSSHLREILRNEFGYSGPVYADKSNEKSAPDCDKIDVELAREIALRSAVLLKNSDSILPLNKNIELAVIGDISLCSGFVGKLEENNELDYTYECEYDLSDSAIKNAAKADAAVIFVGNQPSRKHLCTDRLDFSLPECQNRLIEEICCVNRNTIVVVQNDSLVSLPWANMVAAIIYQPCADDIGSAAVYDILAGNTSPAGRLAETWPERIEDMPAYLSFANDRFLSPYKESIFVGYRYYSSSGTKPLYPFGHGLSYCKFEYSSLRLTKNKLSFSVTNSSKRNGDEVVQVYVRPPRSNNIIREELKLCDYRRVSISAGETERLSFDISPDWFSFYNTATNSRECEGGEFTVLIGTSSVDIRLQRTVALEPTTTEFPSYKATAPAYLMPQSFRKPFNVSDNEFEALLGRQICRNYPSEEVTLDTPLLDLPENLLSRLFTKLVLELRLPKKLDDSEVADVEFAILSKPVRCFLKSGPNTLVRALVNAFCFLLGGNIFARLKTGFIKYMFE